MTKPVKYLFEIPTRAAWGISRLPSRAQSIVDAELRRSEWRIALVQAFIIAFIAVLFFAAPAPTGPVLSFRPVPYALMVMVIALAGRIFILAASPPVLRLLSFIGVIIDISVIIALIWSFHLQYGQPAAFYLKAPTQLYLFVVIALHGLALDPTRVAFAGVIAAIGWVFLTLFALYNGGSSMVTRDFVVYMTSTRILIGAEVDRVVAILLFAAVLSIGIASARAQMLTAALGVSATDELSRFFAAGLASRIASASDRAVAGRATKKQAAIMVIDIRNFTYFAAGASPEEVLAMLSEFQSRVVKAVSEHGGAVDKFLGDGILATFGCLQATDRPAADALGAARDALASIAEGNDARRTTGQPTIEVGAAVAFGDVLFGTIGFGDRLEFTVVGNPVNRAAKLEKYNKVIGSTLATDRETFVAAEAQGFVAKPLAMLEGRHVTGIPQAIDIFVLSRSSASEADAKSHFHAREGDEAL